MSLLHALKIDPLLAEGDSSPLPATSMIPPEEEAAMRGLRGDGVFETIGVVDGQAQDVQGHLERFAHSARMLDLPLPHAGQWQAAIAEAVAACPSGEAGIRLVLSRRGDGAAEALVTAEAAPDFSVVRSAGVRVVTLDRGFSSGTGAKQPWMLLTAKTLSYAQNLAALREARRRGADDAIFATSDGYLLEGATSSVILQFDDRFVTPDPRSDILRGTAQQRVFRSLARDGHAVAEELVPVSALVDAEAVWLVSSLRRAVPVVAVDGESRSFDPTLTARINRILLQPA